MSKIECICKYCGGTMYVSSYDKNRGGGKYCSRSCSSKSYKRPVTERIWEKVNVKSEFECWEYKEYLNACGYGVISGDNNKKMLAHRVSYMSKYGDFDLSLKVLHKCDNPACCNPNHLFLGTQADNVSDMYNKGRNVIVNGERRQNSKLTESLVSQIRNKYNGRNSLELSKKYKVSRSNIIAIINRQTWKHI